MANKRPPPTESQLAESLKLKDEGNKAYREKQFGTAIKHYTSALSIAPTRELFSNRAAVFLALKQPYQALNDINSSLALSPLFYRAIRRKALILETLEREAEALGVLREIIKVMGQEGDQFELGAKAEAEKKEVLKKVAELQKKLEKPVGMMGVAKTEDMEEMMPGMRVWRSVKQGGVIPAVGTTARRLYDAEVQFREGLRYLKEFKIMGSEGIRGQLQTLETLTSAMICDIRVSRFEREDIDKLQLCYAFEQAARNAVGHEYTPEKTIEEYAQRLTKPKPGRAVPEAGKDTPWDFVRPALQVTIRCWLMNGLFKFVTDPQAHGAMELKSAIRIIELAREKWADVPPVIRGFTLQETFLRQIYCLYGESLMMQYINKHRNLSHPQKISLLEEIITTAEWIVKSKTTTCKAPPASERVADEPSYWNLYYTHYLTPLARAHALLGFSHMNIAPLLPIHITPSGPVSFGQAPASELEKYPSIQDTRHITLAAVHYTRAASLFPVDEPDRLNTLWYAIACLIYRGGYLPAELELARDMAQRGTVFCEPLFGPAVVPEDNVGKDLSRRHPGPEPEGRYQTLLPTLSWDTVLHKNLDQNEWRRYLWAYNETVVHPELYGGDGEEGSKGKENWRGMLSLVGIMMNVWRERIEGEPGERVQNVGVGAIYGKAEERAKAVWEKEVGGWIGAAEGRREVSL